MAKLERDLNLYDPTCPAVSLTLDGDFYARFIDGKSYSAEALQAIQESVRKLLEQPTSINKPGMLLGKVQSGKTKTFMGIMALGFDNAFDVCVVLTKGTKALTKQTFERLEKEFAPFNVEDLVQVFDIMTIPSSLTAWELNQKLIFVVKKQADNLNRLSKAFFETHPVLSKKKMLYAEKRERRKRIYNRLKKLIIGQRTQQEKDRAGWVTPLCR